MPRSKVMPVEEAVARIEPGMTLAIAGFLNQGAPLTLIRALRARGVGDLVLYANDAGFGDEGIVELILAGLVRELHCCHVGYTPEAGKAAARGDFKLVWVPQGNLIEMLRCGGAGLGGFLTPVGVGTAAAEGREEVVVDGRRYLWEKAVRADAALVRAHAGDTYGNLCHRATARNYNTVVATCARYTVAEVEHAYSVGELDPEKVHTPGVFVDAVVRADMGNYGVKAATPCESPGTAPPAPDCRCIIAARAAQELADGHVTNLGAGIPMLVANYLPPGADVVIQAENGIAGVGPVAAAGTEDSDRRNAGNLYVTLLPGGCYFDSVTSFGMIRGGHVTATMLGTLQVDGEGNIANWEMPGRKIGMGGAMDLVAGARTVYILTEHCAKDGSPKLVRRCTLPLTGAGECDVIITERALFRRRPGRGFALEEVACGHTLEEIAACTEMAYTVADDVKLDAYG